MAADVRSQLSPGNAGKHWRTPTKPYLGAVTPPTYGTTPRFGCWRWRTKRALALAFRPARRSYRFADFALRAHREYLATGESRLPHIPSSLCLMVSPSEVCVLPKTRTAQVGCTLRTMSHHLALLPPQSRVVARWHTSLSLRSRRAISGSCSFRIRSACRRAPLSPGSELGRARRLASPSGMSGYAESVRGRASSMNSRLSSGG